MAVDAVTLAVEVKRVDRVIKHAVMQGAARWGDADLLYRAAMGYNAKCHSALVYGTRDEADDDGCRHTPVVFVACRSALQPVMRSARSSSWHALLSQALSGLPWRRMSGEMLLCLSAAKTPELCRCAGWLGTGTYLQNLCSALPISRKCPVMHLAKSDSTKSNVLAALAVEITAVTRGALFVTR